MRKIDLKTYVRPDLRTIESYVPGEYIKSVARRFNVPIEKVVKLNANENPYGPSPRAKKAVANVLLQFYPPSSYDVLRKKIATYTGISKESIIVGNGSDELIDLLLRLVLRPGNAIITCPPTFTMYEIYTKLNNGKVVAANRQKDFSLNIPSILSRIESNTRVVFLCNPNNPTGTLTPRSQMQQLLETGILVVVDEAYFEFANQSAAPLLKQYPNLIVLRTFSKWAGLAGLRIGYGLMDPYFVKQLLAIKPPFNVNIAAEKAALASLEDISFGQKAVKNIVQERERMFVKLQSMPDIQVYRSWGNFLFVQVKGAKRYQQLRKAFEKEKIALRYFPSIGNGIRITIGTEKQNDLVAKILTEVLTK